GIVRETLGIGVEGRSHHVPASRIRGALPLLDQRGFRGRPLREALHVAIHRREERILKRSIVPAPHHGGVERDYRVLPGAGCELLVAARAIRRESVRGAGASVLAAPEERLAIEHARGLRAVGAAELA